MPILPYFTKYCLPNIDSGESSYKIWVLKDAKVQKTVISECCVGVGVFSVVVLCDAGSADFLFTVTYEKATYSR